MIRILVHQLFMATSVIARSLPGPPLHLTVVPSPTSSTPLSTPPTAWEVQPTQGISPPEPDDMRRPRVPGSPRALRPVHAHRVMYLGSTVPLERQDIKQPCLLANSARARAQHLIKRASTGSEDSHNCYSLITGGNDLIRKTVALPALEHLLVQEEEPVAALVMSANLPFPSALAS